MKNTGPAPLQKSFSRLVLSFAVVTGVMLMIGAAEAAPLIVTNTADSGAGSLRQAIGASPAGGSIAFNIPTSDPGYDPSTGYFIITLTSGELVIGRDLTIAGLPATATIAIGGNHASRVFNIVAGSVSISNLTIFSGLIIGTAGTPGTMQNSNGGSGGLGEGGGILNGGTLTLTDCYLIGNNAVGGDGGSAPVFGGVGGAGGPGRGGAISNSGSLALVRCSFATNHVGGGAGGTGGAFGGTGGAATGGVIYNSGSLSLIQTTISDGGASGGQGATGGGPFGGNGGSGSGGGIYNAGALTITSSTLVNCVATGKDGGKAPGTGGNGGAASGGNLFQVNGAGFSAPRSVIIALGTVTAGLGAPPQNGGNPGVNGIATGPDVAGAVSSQGHNLIGRTDGSSGWSASDLLGGATPATALNPLLAPFQDNGGPTVTRRPLSTSAAVDNGDDFVLGPPSNLTSDQRGYPRKVGMHVDIGAVEVGLPQTGPTFTVTNLAIHDDGCSSDDCTLLEAVNTSNATAGNNVINFAAEVTGIIRTGLNGFVINNSVTINGPGARSLTINGLNFGRLFAINGSGSVVNISGLSLINGRASGSAFPNNVGGAILNAASLTLTDCALSGNSSTSAGGCIYNNGSSGNATLTLARCTLSGNSATSSGGAILNAGYNGHATVNLTNCTLDQNSAQYGGAIYNDGTSNGNASITLTNCTLNKNSAGTIAGGIYNDALNPSSSGIATVVLRNSILRAGTSGANLYHDSAAGGGGSITSQGNNLSGDAAGGDATTGPAGFLNAAGDKRNTDPKLDILKNNGGPTDTVAVLSDSPAIDAGNDANAPGSDQRGFPRVGVSDIGAFEFGSSLPTPTPTPTATPTATPGLVGNVSTRLPVGTDDNVLIEGFIVQGPAGSTKKILVRAIGPALAPFGITDALANPTLEIRSDSNATIARNYNWRTTQTGGIITGDQSGEIATSGAAPSNDLESAIIADLAPGSYTAVVAGSGGTVGTGVVDAYDLSAASSARLANVATRGLIQPGDKLMIAGFIVQNGPVQAVVRAIGPSLSAFGINNALPDTTLQVKKENGTIVMENDDWQTSQKVELENIGLQPSHPLEAAVVVTLPPGQYTAQVRGKPETTGIGVVQVYFLQ